MNCSSDIVVGAVATFEKALPVIYEIVLYKISMKKNYSDVSTDEKPG